MIEKPTLFLQNSPCYPANLTKQKIDKILFPKYDVLPETYLGSQKPTLVDQLRYDSRKNYNAIFKSFVSLRIATLEQTKGQEYLTGDYHKKKFK